MTEQKPKRTRGPRKSKAARIAELDKAIEKAQAKVESLIAQRDSLIDQARKEAEAVLASLPNP